MRLPTYFIAALTLTACASQPDYRAETAPPPTVASVDLSEYAGKWYEIARYPNRFEDGCAGVTAEYTPQPNGKITVTNTCREGGLQGPARVAEGVARVVDGSNNAKLKVKFAPAWVPFASGDYWVLHIEPGYTAALVGDPSGKYLWILAREAELSDETLARIKARAEELGYDTAPFEMTVQG